MDAEYACACSAIECEWCHWASRLFGHSDSKIRQAIRPAPAPKRYPILMEYETVLRTFIECLSVWQFEKSQQQVLYI